VTTLNACTGLQLHMFKVVESWAVMDKEVLTGVVHVLLHAGYIGSRGTLILYQMGVSKMMRAYHQLTGKVCMPLTGEGMRPPRRFGLRAVSLHGRSV